MEKFIGYIRVSTDKQGDSGLGLEAQKQAIIQFATARGQLTQIFVEVESATRKERLRFNSKLSLAELLSSRPVLLEAINAARKHKAVLLVKEHSRLTRSKLVIEWLMSSQVNFICSDSANDTPQIISIKVGFAEEEAKKIGERTKAALEVKRATYGEWRTGHKLFISGEAAKIGTAAIQRKARLNINNRIASELIQSKHAKGWTLQQIANYLNDTGHTTARGARFTTTQVSRIL